MSQTDRDVKHWDPSKFLRRGGSIPYTVIVLNQPIENMTVFSNVTERASQIVAADGGANHIYDIQPRLPPTAHIHPDFIIGDLDSIRPDVRAFYEERKETKFVYDPNQNHPDFTKCLKFVARDHRSSKVQRQKSSWDNETWSTVAFGGLNGRADQAFAQIHQLYMPIESPDLYPRDIFLFTPQSIMFVLEKGKNVIKTPVNPEELAESVGIIPITGPTKITLKGFEWDVEDWHTSFGTRMSTSQHIKADEVTVISSDNVLFTVDLAQKL